MTRDRVLQTIRESVRNAVREKQDLNKDGKNDFEDVMIARMKASGMDHEDAVEKGEKTAKKAEKNQSSKNVSETKLTSSLLRQLLNKELSESNLHRGVLSELETVGSASKNMAGSASKKKEGPSLGGTEKMDPKKSQALLDLLKEKPTTMDGLLTVIAKLKSAGLSKIQGVGSSEIQPLWDVIQKAIKAAAGEGKLTKSAAGKVGKSLGV